MQLTADMKKVKESINKLQAGETTALDGTTEKEIKNTSKIFTKYFEAICLKSNLACKYL